MGRVVGEGGQGNLVGEGGLGGSSERFVGEGVRGIGWRGVIKEKGFWLRSTYLSLNGRGSAVSVKKRHIL